MGLNHSKGDLNEQDEAAFLRAQTAQAHWSYMCDSCTKVIIKTRHTCSNCLRYDLCETCHAKVQHEHLMYRVEDHPQVMVNLIRQQPTSGQALLNAFQLYANRIAFHYRAPSQSINRSSFENYPVPSLVDSTLPPLDPFNCITYSELEKRVLNIGNGLRSLIPPRSFVLICSHVQLSWYLADYACQIHSMIGPMIGPNCSLEGIAHILNTTNTKLAFVSRNVLPLFLDAASSCPALQYIIQLEDMAENDYHPRMLQSRSVLRRNIESLQNSKNTGFWQNFYSYMPSWPLFWNNTTDANIKSEENLCLLDEQVQELHNLMSQVPRPAVLSLSDVELLGTHIQRMDPVITNPNDLETLVYTSGSTGLPKGVMFTASAWKAQVVPNKASPTIERTITWSVSDRMNDMRQLCLGSTVGIYNGDITRIFEDIFELEPHQLNATPSFWNKIYAEYKADLEELTASLDTASTEYVTKYHQVRKSLMQRYKKLSGRYLDRIVTGGAPTSLEVLDFMWDCFSCRVAESYGTTECGAVTVAGKFVHNMEWKLVPWEEYNPSDAPNPRGELCIKKSDMMLGYFADEATTKEALDEDGYYHTGDIVELNAQRDGATIIDRKKNIFKLAQGEFVAPAKIEKLMIGKSPMVKQIFVYGDTLNNSLVAIVVPHQQVIVERLKELAGPNEKLDAETDICRLPQAIVLVTLECARIGKEHHLRSFEIPAAVHLTNTTFTVENGLQTQSDKPARHALAKRFRLEIEAMYRQINAMQTDTKNAVTKMFQEELRALALAVASSSAPTDSSPSPFSSSSDTQIRSNDSTILDSKAVSFVQAGGDSLSAIKLRNRIKNSLNVNIPTQLLLDPKLSIEQVASIVSDPNWSISEASASSSSSSSSILNPNEIVKIRGDWKPAQGDTKSSAEGHFSKLNNGIFLTGTTGFLGLAVLCELINSGAVMVYCLYRFPKAHIAQSMTPKQMLLDRIQRSGLLEPQVFDKLSDEFDQRITLLEGSLEQTHFGWSDQTWNDVCQNVSIVIHCGAFVNSVLPLSRLCPANVEGTRTCIELCGFGAYKLLLYISTTSVIDVFSEAKEDRLDDREIREHNLERVSGYTGSKYLAERLVWNAVTAGLPAIVVRPGFIGSSSKSGYANVNDFDNRLIVGMTQLGVAPYHSITSSTSTKLISIPVDYLAQMLVSMLQHSEECIGHSYNADNTASVLTLQMIVDVMNERGYKLEYLTYAKWKELVHTNLDERNPIYPMVEAYFSTSSFPARRPRIPTTQCMNFIRRNMNKDIPPTDQPFVSTWLQWLEANGHLQRPSQPQQYSQ